MTSGAWVPPVDIYRMAITSWFFPEGGASPTCPARTSTSRWITGRLTIKGEKKLGNDVREEQFHRIERRIRTFSGRSRCRLRSDPNKVAAEYRNGVLTVSSRCARKRSRGRSRLM